MKYKIIDPKYIKSDTFVSDYIRKCPVKAISDKIVRGLSNKANVTVDTVFTAMQLIGKPSESHIDYAMLENDNGIFIVRVDNIKTIEELSDIYKRLNINKIIKSGKATILIDSKPVSEFVKDDNMLAGIRPTVSYKKFTTFRDEFDNDDAAKALMILLLKREGYNISDIYAVAETLPQEQVATVISGPEKSIKEVEVKQVKIKKSPKKSV